MSLFEIETSLVKDLCRFYIRECELMKDACDITSHAHRYRKTKTLLNACNLTKNETVFLDNEDINVISFIKNM